MNDNFTLVFLSLLYLNNFNSFVFSSLYYYFFIREKVPTQDPVTCASKTALPLDGSCSIKDGTWIDAKETCESVGTRLCTLDDLESGLGWGTGCKSNKALLWTSTPCNEFPADSYGWYYQVNQSETTSENAHRKCVPMTERALVSPVCCADSLCNQVKTK
jgi:hypothetical protein